jgi:hypothetical protein
MKHVSEKRAEWLEQYKRILQVYIPSACARCGIKGNNWKHFNGDFEPHHPFRRTTRAFCCVILPLCHECHEWVHHNSKQAKEEGWLVSPKPNFLNMQ